MGRSLRPASAAAGSAAPLSALERVLHGVGEDGGGGAAGNASSDNQIVRYSAGGQLAVWRSFVWH